MGNGLMFAHFLLSYLLASTQLYEILLAEILMKNYSLHRDFYFFHNLFPCKM